jgi:hypothetical protein
MSLRIEHRLGVKATADQIWALLEDLPAWPSWNPMYPQAKGRIGFGELLTLTEALPGGEPRALTPRVSTWTPREQIVWVEKRGLMANSIRYFEIDELSPEGGCIFANGEIFSGWLGERYAKRHGRALKEQYEAVCEALRARVEGCEAP